MNTQLLNYAIEIERSGSITKAAQNLFMAQPNLSKSLRELEEQLGYDIFERTPTGMFPTDKGSAFLKHAHNILGQLDEISQIGKPKNHNFQEFRVSIPRGSYIAGGCTDFVAQLNPEDGMSVTIQETNSIQAIHNVAFENFNLGIIRYQKMYENYFLDYLSAKQLKFEPIWNFEYVLLLPKAHPLANKPHILEEDLSPYIEISHGDTEVPFIDSQRRGNTASTANNKHIYVYERGSQFDLLTKIPTSYMLVSPLPDFYLNKYNLIQRACSLPNNIYHDILIFRKDYIFSRLDKLFQQKLFESRIEVSTKIYD